MRAMYEFFGGGVASADSILIASGIFCASNGDPARAILIAVNMGSDADTIAAIAGEIAGAYSGHASFPQGWVDIVQDTNQLELEALAHSLIGVAGQWQSS